MTGKSTDIPNKLTPRNHVAHPKKSTFIDWLSLASNALSTESLVEKYTKSSTKRTRQIGESLTIGHPLNRQGAQVQGRIPMSERVNEIFLCQWRGARQRPYKDFRMSHNSPGLEKGQLDRGLRPMLIDHMRTNEKNSQFVLVRQKVRPSGYETPYDTNSGFVQPPKFRLAGRTRIPSSSGLCSLDELGRTDTN